MDEANTGKYFPKTWKLKNWREGGRSGADKILVCKHIHRNNSTGF